MKEYDKVRFLTNKFSDDGITQGVIGYIIEDYNDGNFEVEVSNKKTGETIAQVVASSDDIELVE